MKKYNLLEEPVEKLFLKYLAPSISATLVTSIYILADTLMIGRGVGAIGIAALNIILPLFSLFFGLGMLFGVGGGVLLSVSKGRGDERGAREYFTTALTCTLIAAVVFTVVGHSLFDPITSFLGRNETMDHYVRDYGRILVSGAPVFMFSSFLQAFVRNDRAPKTAMTAVIAGGVTNVVLDYIFIFPMGMGMAGAAIATVIGSVLTLVILSTHFLRKDNSLKIVPVTKAPHKAGQIFVSGLASFLLEMSNGIVTFLFNRRLLALVGEIGVVVYGIICNSALIVSSISNGISQAAQPILAVNFGAGKRERLKKTRHMGQITAVAAGILFTLIGICFPDVVTELFVVPTKEIMDMSESAVRIYFLAFLFMGFNIFAGTWFQSVMKPGYSMILCLLRGLILNSLFLFTLTALFGVTGAWLTMPVTEAVTMCIGFALIRKNDRASSQAGKGGGEGQRMPY